MKIALYAGTFDPITHAHVDVIARASKLFDELIIAVGTSHAKKTLFDLETRTRFCTQSVAIFKNVRVIALSGLAVDCAAQNNASYLVRGIRDTNDVNAELSMANMNRTLSDEGIETVFFASSDQYRSVSSTIVREIISHHGDVSSFVPAAVLQDLNQ